MYGLLASGHMDLCFEASLSPYDFAALVPVVEGAGGMMCDWNGKPLTLTSDGRVIALGDQTLKQDVLKIIQG
jgi:fructose-1,6-bisphosphatase/inositol monophosphatase family enzyme